MKQVKIGEKIRKSSLDKSYDEKENEPIKLYEKNPNLKFKKYLLTLKDYSNEFSDRFEVLYNKKI